MIVALICKRMPSLQLRAHAPAGGWKGSDRETPLSVLNVRSCRGLGAEMEGEGGWLVPSKELCL